MEKVCSRETLLDEVSNLAKKIASNGPLALKACKKAIDRGIELSLNDALELELEEYGKVTHSNDAEGGMAAFLEKKTPTFRGN